MAGSAPGRPKRKRWGLRALAFLSLAFVSIMVSNGLSATGHRGGLPITFLGTLIGLGGALYCSYRGLREAKWLPRP